LGASIPPGNLLPIVNVSQALLIATGGTTDTNRSTAPCSALAVRRQHVLPRDDGGDRQPPCQSTPDEHATRRPMTARVDKALSLDRRATARCLVAVLLAACTLGAPGCSVCRQARRTLIQEPLEYSSKGDRARSLKAYRQWADEAWSVERRACPEVAGNSDYALGFRDGFVDYIYAGGDGQPPPVPPRKFWNVGWRTPDGDVGAQQWFAGYRHGAQSARNSGLRQNGVVLSSYLAMGQMEGPSPESGISPPSYYGESLSDPQEPLPSPNGEIVPSIPSGADESVPMDGEGLSYPPGVDGPGAEQPEAGSVGPDPQTSRRSNSTTTGLYTDITPPMRSASPTGAPAVPFEPIHPVELPAPDGLDVASAVQQALAVNSTEADLSAVAQAVGETAVEENGVSATGVSPAIAYAPGPAGSPAESAAQTAAASPERSSDSIAGGTGHSGAAAAPAGGPTGPIVPAEPIPGDVGTVPAVASPAGPPSTSASEAAARFRRASVPAAVGPAEIPVDRPIVSESPGDGGATSAAQRFRRAVSPFRSSEPNATY
jgi:hypothetical protein